MSPSLPSNPTEKLQVIFCDSLRRFHDVFQNEQPIIISSISRVFPHVAKDFQADERHQVVAERVVVVVLAIDEVPPKPGYDSQSWQFRADVWVTFRKLKDILLQLWLYNYDLL